MNIVCRSAFALSFALLVLASPAAADGFRCGNYLARDGMQAATIKERCGEPDLRETLEEPVFATLENGLTVQIGVNVTHHWYYSRAPGQFVARVVVRGSIVEDIELLKVRDLESLKEG